MNIAHPLKVKADNETSINQDKIDTMVPAHLLRCGLLPEACVMEKATRSTQNVLRQRTFFVRVRTIIKKPIWHLVDCHSELANSMPCKELFFKPEN